LVFFFTESCEEVFFFFPALLPSVVAGIAAATGSSPPFPSHPWPRLTMTIFPLFLPLPTLHFQCIRRSLLGPAHLSPARRSSDSTDYFFFSDFSPVPFNPFGHPALSHSLQPTERELLSVFAGFPTFRHVPCLRIVGS